MGSRSFPKSVRLRRRPEFVRVQRRGQRRTTDLFVVIWFPQPKRSNGSPRFGFTVSKKVGNAVVRNRVKRLLREAVRHELPEITSALQSLDVVILARQAASTADHATVRAQVHRALQQIVPFPSPASGRNSGRSGRR